MTAKHGISKTECDRIYPKMRGNVVGFQYSLGVGHIGRKFTGREPFDHPRPAKRVKDENLGSANPEYSTAAAVAQEQRVPR